MDRIRKFLKRLSSKERVVVEEVVERVLQHDFSGLDVKKLRGGQNEFRVRKGNIRIVFSVDEGEICVHRIERRDDTTYK